MEKLLKLRKAKGFRQVDIANILKVSKQCYSNYEKGLREPDCDTLSKLADFYGVTVDYLIGRTPTREEREKGVRDFILTPDKEELLMYYEEMTPEEKKQILNFARFICDNSKK